MRSPLTSELPASVAVDLPVMPEIAVMAAGSRYGLLLKRARQSRRTLRGFRSGNGTKFLEESTPRLFAELIAQFTQAPGFGVHLEEIECQEFLEHGEKQCGQVFEIHRCLDHPEPTRLVFDERSPVLLGRLSELFDCVPATLQFGLRVRAKISSDFFVARSVAYRLRIHSFPHASRLALRRSRQNRNVFLRGP